MGVASPVILKEIAPRLTGNQVFPRSVTDVAKDTIRPVHAVPLET